KWTSSPLDASIAPPLLGHPYKLETPMRIATTLTVAVLMLGPAQLLRAQETTATDRQAAAAALALLEARGDLPSDWIAAPAEIVEGDGSFEDSFDKRPGVYIDGSRERAAPI